MIKIIGIKITDRIKEAGLTQEVLSKHASLITTRLGFHEFTTEICSREAYIILHISGENVKADQLVFDLRQIGGIEIRDMTFGDDGKFVNFTPEEGALRILGILVEKRGHDAVAAIQKAMTVYGCIIRTRLGVNEELFGQPAGLILLELMGDEIRMDLLENDLQKIPGIKLRKMAF